jgi:multidrug transporter EmrE-like cation transporter
MNANALALILTSVTLSAFAQIAFKFGVAAAARTSAQTGPLAVLLTPGVQIGLSLYVLGTLIWLKALAQVELSQAYPFVGLGFAITALAGWLVLGDTLSAQRIVGIGMLIASIIVIARS